MDGLQPKPKELDRKGFPTEKSEFDSKFQESTWGKPSPKISESMLEIDLLYGPLHQMYMQRT